MSFSYKFILNDGVKEQSEIFTNDKILFSARDIHYTNTSMANENVKGGIEPSLEFVLNDATSMQMNTVAEMYNYIKGVDENIAVAIQLLSEENEITLREASPIQKIDFKITNRELEDHTMDVQFSTILIII